MSDLVGNPEDRFSHNEAHMKVGFEGSILHERISMMSIRNESGCLHHGNISVQK